MNRTLLKNINKFYKHYDLEHTDTLTMSRSDMYNHDALMSAYESLWLTIDQYDTDAPEYQWLVDLYAELGDYISHPPINKVIKTVCTALSVFGVFSAGAMTAVSIEYGMDLTLGVGLVVSVLDAILYGIAAYKYNKE